MASNSPALTLEDRVKRLEMILGALGEVLKAGTTEGKDEWKDPPAGHFKTGEIEKMLYTLGHGLTGNQPECPPWCGKTLDEGESTGGSEDEETGSQEETK